MPAEYQIYIVLGLLLIVFIAFIKEKFAPDTVALAAMAALLAVGVLHTDDFLSVFSSSAPITIAMMFIISAALERTGCLQLMGNIIEKIAGQSYIRAMIVMMMLVMVASAFMNNTPVVIVMTPIVISLAKAIGVNASRMLIPLSFAAIFGGTTTLIGTSTNILVSGIAAKNDLPAVGMFEMTIPGLIFAAVGMVYMIFAGRYLLPDRMSISSLLDGQNKRQFMAEFLIPHHSSYVGKPISDIKEISDVTSIIDVIRRNRSQRDAFETLELQAGDRIVIETNTGDVLGLTESGQIEFKAKSENLEPVTADEKVIMEGSVSARSALIGKSVSSLNFRRKYGVYILGVHRNDTDIKKDLDHISLRFADTLLIEGTAENIARLLEEGNLINLGAPQEKATRKTKAPIAFLTLLGVVGLAAFGVMPIAGLALIGAVIVMLTGCVDADEAYQSIDWRILFLIFGMLGLSMGMEKTGAAAMIVEHVVSWIGDLGPVAVLAMIYVLTSILTEMVSNNAVSVLLAPIVIGLADQMGVDSRPFLMTVMFAASASFATPIGYQTNTFVYSAGGYKFNDFLKVGVPLNIIYAILATLVLPLFFPF